MKMLKFLFAFAASLLCAVVLGSAVGPMVGVSTSEATSVLMGASLGFGIIKHFAPTMPGVAYMAIQQEFWVDYIMENLFPDNSILNLVFDESAHVLGGSVVHIPQAGAKPTIVKNRSSFPAAAVQRTDTDITYPLDVYTSDPTHITNAEQMEISYDKMNSVMGEHLLAMSELVTDELLVKWTPALAANIVRTTGALSAENLGGGATGTRKILLKEDLRAAQKRMNKLNIPKPDRYCLLPADMADELLGDADLLKRDNATELDLRMGVIANLYGFKIMDRGTVNLYDNTGTPVVKAVGAAGAITDNQGAICWQRNALGKALGTTEMYSNENDPLYYGDIYSALQKMGGRKRRTAEEGIVAIVQSA